MLLVILLLLSNYIIIMSKSKSQFNNIDNEVTKEYQNIIRKLQEELYNLKNSNAIHEEIQKNLKESEYSLHNEIVI